ncbi:STAS domain-containing protein [Kibdelosporangium persicum]|uniref:Anti-sigma factor antagonist n=1 Tax=Kibdelosporangium persicum TaxID=2698649 RepID=A0ABX2F750_9PSEU|nr:STAS domain-containing protein [Kibdelosporangium persicum]NRN66974.1 hypothetical protein [Kibdelosporangium persicum]
MAAYCTRPAGSPPAIEVIIEQVHDIPVARVRGEIDLATRLRFAEPVLNELASRPGELIVDLTDVGFLGSAGIVVLVQAHRHAEQNQVGLHLVASPTVLRVLDIAGVTTLFTIRGSVTEAISHITARRPVPRRAAEEEQLVGDW